MNFPVGARVVVSVAGAPNVPAAVAHAAGRGLCLVLGRAILVPGWPVPYERIVVFFDDAGAWRELATGTPVAITLDPRPDPEVR